MWIDPKSFLYYIFKQTTPESTMGRLGLITNKTFKGFISLGKYSHVLLKIIKITLSFEFSFLLIFSLLSDNIIIK